MHLLIISLCAVATILIVLDATPCSMDKRKEMLLKVCGGHYRRKRGSAFNDYSYDDSKGKGKSRSMNQNDLQFGEKHHHRHDHVHVIANDTTGGILIRRKRGSLEDFMYCCLDLGNCTFIC